MAEEQEENLTELATACEEALESLAWIKAGVKDQKGVQKVMRARRKLQKAVDAYMEFSDEIEKLDFDDAENEKWFAKWRELKNDISEIEARMESTLAVVAKDDDDAFDSDDSNDNPNEQGIAASLQLADDINNTLNKDIERLVGILNMTEEMKDMANQCLEELEGQREKLMRINAKLKAIDKGVERGGAILEKIKVNMLANKMCWGIGCTIIWLLVGGVIAVGVICAPDGPLNMCGAAVSALNDVADQVAGTTTTTANPEAVSTAGSRRLRGFEDSFASEAENALSDMLDDMLASLQ